MACNCQNSKDREKEPQDLWTSPAKLFGGNQSVEMSGSQDFYLADSPVPTVIMTSKAAGKKSASPSPIIGPKPQNLDVKLNINYDEENHTIKLAVLINGENYEYSPMSISEFAQKLGIPRFDEFNHLERKG